MSQIFTNESVTPVTSRSLGPAMPLGAEVAPVMASDLESLRLELSASFSRFGLVLMRALNPQAKRGFSKSYTIALCKGQRPITPDIAKAFWRIAAAHDDVDPTTTTAQAVTVYATESIAGALVTGKAQPCARPGCQVRFVRNAPNQLYHSRQCQRKANRK